MFVRKKNQKRGKAFIDKQVPQYQGILPFTEKELLKNITPKLAHADAIEKITIESIF